MKIEAKDPEQSEQWLCDGKSIYQFDYPKELVTEFVMPPELQGKGIGDGPLPFVFGVEAQKLKQRYFMRIITPPDVQNEVWLEAFPRYQQQAAEFSKVQVILQIAGPTKALLPYAIQIYSPNGKDRTVYQLQNPEINPPVSGLDRRHPGQRLVEAVDPLRLDEEDRLAPAAGASRAESLASSRRLKSTRRNSLPIPDLRTP